MAYPRARHATYQDGNPPVPDDDLFNGVQDEGVNIWAPYYANAAIVCADDFCSAAVPAQWTQIGSIAVIADGIGCLKAETSVGQPTAAIELPEMAIGTRPFRFASRIRFPSADPSCAAYVGWGSPAEGAADRMRFVTAAPFTSWFYETDAGAVSAGVAPDATFRALNIERFANGAIQFAIDGNIIATVASSQIATPRLYIGCQRGIGDVTMHIDRAYCIVFNAV
jgi:hypothetical protein